MKRSFAVVEDLFNKFFGRLLGIFPTHFFNRLLEEMAAVFG